jgi:hypothetical protein
MKGDITKSLQGHHVQYNDTELRKYTLKTFVSS